MNSPDPHKYEKQLEQWASRELRKIPDATAPAALKSRVMAAIAAREAMPWYRRAWMTWPLLPQAVSVLVFISAGVGLSMLSGSIVGAAEGTRLATTFGYFTACSQLVWSLIEALASAGALMLQHTSPWLLAGVSGALFAMYMSCIGMGTIFYRMILKTTRN